MKTYAAYTTLDASYPAFFNFSEGENGSVKISLRGEAKTSDGVYVCGYAPRDAGQPGRCTPGDDHCNNYCNLAPEKGPMVDKPKACQHIDAGLHVSASFPKAEVIAVLEKTLAELKAEG